MQRCFATLANYCLESGHMPYRLIVNGHMDPHETQPYKYSKPQKLKLCKLFEGSLRGMFKGSFQRFF